MYFKCIISVLRKILRSKGAFDCNFSLNFRTYVVYMNIFICLDVKTSPLKFVQAL